MLRRADRHCASRPRGGGGPKRGTPADHCRLAGSLSGTSRPGKGGKWKFEHASFGIVDSRAQAEQFDAKRAGPMNSWLEKKKKPSASPATADGPLASTKRPRPAATRGRRVLVGGGEPASGCSDAEGGRRPREPAAPSRATASASPWRRARGKGGAAKAKARGGAGGDSDRGAPSAAAAVSASDALETLLASKRQHEKALEEMEARVEETVDHFYDQGEAGKLRVRQEFRDLYG